jgi:NAD(P)-dependent dehydrogenase (short-subunit alcohol dehydrogenase family)
MDRILIVGASRGIGAELARSLRGEARLWGVSREPGSDGFEATRSWDAGSQDFPAEFVPARLNGLVYCPGTIRLEPFGKLTDQAYEDDFRVNLLGAVRAIRAALPALKAAEQASIVLFSTVAVTTGMPMHACVAAAKGAVEGLTRSLAAEFAPQIRVNAIAPSLTDTPLAGALLRTDRQRSAAADRHPLERVGDVADQAAAARFLLSREAGWITGQLLHVDGGLGAVRRFK